MKAARDPTCPSTMGLAAAEKYSISCLIAVYRSIGANKQLVFQGNGPNWLELQRSSGCRACRRMMRRRAGRLRMQRRPICTELSFLQFESLRVIFPAACGGVVHFRENSALNGCHRKCRKRSAFFRHACLQCAAAPTNQNCLHATSLPQAREEVASTLHKN
jgi:hypothetical protein